jgi:hypothetical protein
MNAVSKSLKLENSMANSETKQKLEAIENLKNDGPQVTIKNEENFASL